MRILLDSNIIIPLEDSSATLRESLGELSRLAGEYGHILMAHPSSIDDIKRDKDKVRREISLSRLKKYPLLDQPPIPTSEDLKSYNLTQVNDNDRVDNEILFSIYKNAANILITEDRKLHSRADRIGVRDKVHYIQQAVEFLRRLHAKVKVKLPNIQDVPLYQIDIHSPFFDSLRADYNGFNEWYEKSAASGRKAWVHKNDNGDLGALCIFNIEESPIITNSNQALPGMVLKLCTFKVDETVRGRRIGELFLKAAFQYATKNDLEHIYLHAQLEKQAFLVDFITEFGFEYFGDYEADTVYVKEHPTKPLPSRLDPLEYHKKYYPLFINSSAVGKYIVPIRPLYHKILFPDNQRQLSLFNYEGNSGKQVVGNAIRQAYLCHARISGLAPGDILLFYRSIDEQGITSIGIVEHAMDYEDVNDVIPLVSKRTVYSHEEIIQMAEKKTKVVLFRIATHLENPISFKYLHKNQVVKGNIQTIRKISDESFRKIAKKWRVSNCFFAD